MKQEKKDGKRVLAIVLLISLFLNFSLLAFVIDTRHTWQQEQGCSMSRAALSAVMSSPWRAVTRS